MCTCLCMYVCIHIYIYIYIYGEEFLSLGNSPEIRHRRSSACGLLVRELAARLCGAASVALPCLALGSACFVVVFVCVVCV